MMNNGQRSGVAIPQGQIRAQEKTEPGRILAVLALEPVVVKYGNERGEVVDEVWFRSGRDFYRSPQAEEFAASLRLVKDKHAAQTNAILAAQRTPSEGLAATDAVDVVSRQTAAEVTSGGGVDV